MQPFPQEYLKKLDIDLTKLTINLLTVEVMILLCQPAYRLEDNFAPGEIQDALDGVRQLTARMDAYEADQTRSSERIEHLETTIGQMQEEKAEDKEIIEALNKETELMAEQNAALMEEVRLFKEKAFSDAEIITKLQKIADKNELELDEKEKEIRQLKENVAGLNSELEKKDRKIEDLERRLQEKGISKEDWRKVACYALIFGGAVMALYLLKCVGGKAILAATKGSATVLLDFGSAQK